MKRWQQFNNLTIFGILMLLFLASYMNWFTKEENDRIYNISVIINEENDSAWKNARKGMDLAASEYQVDINFITLYYDNSTLQQEELLYREMKNGADAIILAPANSDALTKVMEKMSIKVPIILMNSSILSSKVKSSLVPDDLWMGEQIGERVVSALEEDQNIYILSDYLKRNNLKNRYQGVVSKLKDGNAVYMDENFQTKENIVLWVEDLVSRQENAVIIALEEKHLLAAAGVISMNQENSHIKIYGIGSNNQIILYMEDQVIQGIATPNYFDLGYLSIQQAVLSIKKEAVTEYIEIDSLVVFPNTIYEEENEIRIFPIS